MIDSATHWLFIELVHTLELHHFLSYMYKSSRKYIMVDRWPQIYKNAIITRYWWLDLHKQGFDRAFLLHLHNIYANKIYIPLQLYYFDVEHGTKSLIHFKITKREHYLLFIKYFWQHILFELLGKYTIHRYQYIDILFYGMEWIFIIDWPNTKCGLFLTEKNQI